MKRTIMSYMVATILSLGAVIGLVIQPSALMAQTQTQQTPSPSVASTRNSSSASTAAITPITNPACGEVVQGNVNLTAES